MCTNKTALFLPEPDANHSFVEGVGWGVGEWGLGEKQVETLTFGQFTTKKG